ncbi:CocE/NonD family hydrolase C-terminal non-catalytic domain-containing protein [Nocardia sp. CA-129566]|uniref:CocE/NonD family hydrolase C-terminal non-catalytic domain-containing protein n=1 Tax=Nocardia sp. CA-129566 TaxID=3239976 RepID=UPI003D983211
MDPDLPARRHRGPHGLAEIAVNPITPDSLLTVEPGKPVTLDIAVIPTQAVLAPEHRLRVDIFAANAPKAVAFRPMLNATEFETQYLRLDPDTRGFINLPTNRPIG